MPTSTEVPIADLWKMWSEEELPLDQRTLPGEKVREVAGRLYQEVHDVLMGIPKYARLRAEVSWRGDDPNTWGNVTLPADDSVVYEIYQNPQQGVLIIDKNYRVRINPTTGRNERAISNVEVRTGPSSAIPMYRRPHFSCWWDQNTKLAAKNIGSFLTDLKDRVASGRTDTH